MRHVTKKAEGEIDYSRVVSISLTQANPVAPFNINMENMFSGLQYVRLRAVEIAFAYDGIVQNTDPANGTLGVVLIKSDNKLGPKVVVANPAVRQWGSTSATLVGGALLYNVDPRGTWTGRLSSKAMSGAGSGWDFNFAPNWPKSIVLRFNVQAVPDQSYRWDLVVQSGQSLMGNYFDEDRFKPLSDVFIRHQHNYNFGIPQTHELNPEGGNVQAINPTFRQAGCDGRSNVIGLY